MLPKKEPYQGNDALILHMVNRFPHVGDLFDPQEQNTVLSRLAPPELESDQMDHSDQLRKDSMG